MKTYLVCSAGGPAAGFYRLRKPMSVSMAAREFTGPATMMAAWAWWTLAITVTTMVAIITATAITTAAITMPWRPRNFSHAGGNARGERQPGVGLSLFRRVP